MLSTKSGDLDAIANEEKACREIETSPNNFLNPNNKNLV